MSEVTVETTRALCLLNEENDQLQARVKELEATISSLRSHLQSVHYCNCEIGEQPTEKGAR